MGKKAKDEAETPTITEAQADPAIQAQPADNAGLEQVQPPVKGIGDCTTEQLLLIVSARLEGLPDPDHGAYAIRCGMEILEARKAREEQ